MNKLRSCDAIVVNFSVGAGGVVGLGDAARAPPAVWVERGRRPAAELHWVSARRGADAAAHAAASRGGAPPLGGHAPHRRHRAAPLVGGAAAPAAAQEEHALCAYYQGHQDAPHPAAAAGAADAPQVGFQLFSHRAGEYCR
jgi:hypothetical protein